MKIEIQVENIKCGGCAGSIEKKLLALSGVSQVDINIEQGLVAVESSEAIREALSAELLKMGYPEAGTAEGIGAAAAKAKSFVSCAAGRVDNMINK